MALAAGLGAAVVGAMRDAGLRRIDDLVTHAMLHPKVAEALLRRFPAEPGGRNALHLAAVLRRSAAAAGMATLAAPQAGDQMRRGLEAPSGEKAPVRPLKAANVELWNRKVLHNPDGGYSTTSSISIGTDGGEVLIPTVIDGQRRSIKDAIKHYRDTGQNLGSFRNARDADVYAQWLHEKQAEFIEHGAVPRLKATP